MLKLTRNKICGHMYNWISSYLRDRTGRVSLDGKRSHVIKIPEGVPQGGVISPTLFTIFINDISKNLSIYIRHALHADDVAIWSRSEILSVATRRIQSAVDMISQWAKDWKVEINSTKTVATCFSLAYKKETFRLQIDNQELPQSDTPTYLGVTLDQRLTWREQITNMESRATRRLSLIKKLAGTKWGSNSKVLKKTYIGSVRPVMEYGATSWGTAANSNTERLSKVQNAAMRIITGGLKTTPITELEKTCKLQPLKERRDEKMLIHSEKLKRLPDHPAHASLRERPHTRIKRRSPNHIIRDIAEDHSDIITDDPNQYEKLGNNYDWQSQIHSIQIEHKIPGIQNKDEMPPEILRSLTLEHLATEYDPATFLHVFTDGSAESAISNGGGGVHMRFPDGRRISRSIPTGTLSSNFKAEARALSEAIRMVDEIDPAPPHVAFFTDCRSVLDKITIPDDNTTHEVTTSLSRLSNKCKVSLQWIPAHCGIQGNETADRLAKTGGQMNQEREPLSYKEIKTIIKRRQNDSWNARIKDSQNDPWEEMGRQAQTTIFRLRTGHCRLLFHLHRLHVAHTNECPCGTGLQTPEHVLQECPLHRKERNEHWPEGGVLDQKLWGTREDLEHTVHYIQEIGIDV